MSPLVQSHYKMHFHFILLSFVVVCLMTADGMPCDSCGNECASACGTKHFRTCCFNYLRKRVDPKALKMSTNKRLIDFILLQGRALFTENHMSRENRKNRTVLDLDLQTYYG